MPLASQGRGGRGLGEGRAGAGWAATRSVTSVALRALQSSGPASLVPHLRCMRTAGEEDRGVFVSEPFLGTTVRGVDAQRVGLQARPEGTGRCRF